MMPMIEWGGPRNVAPSAFTSTAITRSAPSARAAQTARHPRRASPRQCLKQDQWPRQQTGLAALRSGSRAGALSSTAPGARCFEYQVARRSSGQCHASAGFCPSPRSPKASFLMPARRRRARRQKCRRRNQSESCVPEERATHRCARCPALRRRKAQDRCVARFFDLESYRIQYHDLRPIAGRVAKIIDGRFDLPFGQGLLDIGACFVECGHDPIRKTAVKVGHKVVAIIVFDLLSRNHDEITKTKVEILFNSNSLLDDLFEL